ncbi:hypothetical protein [Tenacibaculum ovolyticum]|uniref:hypothetical protein n=1 Tax=Tenacibaculum ovolyticum TaxID=104270 RepID=UPI00040F5750|nr:hypothetical protein [Tenacibaculum ovolyticum]
MKTVNYNLYKRGYPIDDEKITFYDANGDNLKDWTFKDAPIVFYEVKFDANGGGMKVEFLHNNKIIQSYYSGEQTLDEVIVTAKGSKNSTTNNQNIQSNYPKGKCHVKCDGFDKNGIYDSTIFTTGKLKTHIKGKRNGIESRIGNKTRFLMLERKLL